MAFLRWRDQGKKAAPESEPAAAPAPPPPEPERDDERPLLSLVYALRTWGQYAVRVETPSQQPAQHGDTAPPPPPFEQWARRTYSYSEGARVDFDDLDRFVLQHRSEEQRSVERALRDLREALWTFVECFSKSTSEDAAADGKSKDSIDRLKEAVVAADVSVIRREAVLTAQTVRSAIASRQQRQRDQIDLLSAKLEDLTSALVRARKDGETDALTGLFNRAAFDGHLKRMANMSVLMATPPLLFMMDIDHFKSVNDEHGHDVGDRAIRMVAARIGATFRRAEDFVARYGGDEFVGILDGVAPGQELAQSDRVLFAIRDIELPTDKGTLRVSCSMGMARAKPGESAEDWFRRADGALYKAKRGGRDRGCLGDDATPN